MNAPTECDACGRSDCPTPVSYEQRSSEHRNCESPGCHVLMARDDMIQLYREPWYCPEHAREQLGMTVWERALTLDERNTAERLAVEGLPAGRSLAYEPDRDPVDFVNWSMDATDEDLLDMLARLLQTLDAELHAAAARLNSKDADVREVATGILHRAGFDTYDGIEEDELRVYAPRYCALDACGGRLTDFDADHHACEKCNRIDGPAQPAT